MKILHINQSDISGGAAIAGYRLHEGLLDSNVISKLLVSTSKRDSETTAKIPRQRYIEKHLHRLISPTGLRDLHLVSTFRLHKHSFFQEADIINFHSLHNGYFNYLALPTLTSYKPAVFTLHDMWSFTGHCSYSYDCSKWKTGCGKCPYPDTYPPISRDVSHIEWYLKKWAYTHSNLTIVTLSSWLTEQAKQSILKHFTIKHIPNGINTNIYRPHDPLLCRAALNIPDNKYVLMFAAEKLKDYRKGGDLLIEALEKLPRSLKQRILLLTFGNYNPSISSQVGIESLNLGYIESDHLKAIVYSAADLFVFPSRADNLPLVLQESMACGTPMVSFNTGGIPDLVRHKITGHLACSGDTDHLCEGIIQLLEDYGLRERMSQNCREIALQEYSLELQVERYITLYQELLHTS